MGPEFQPGDIIVHIGGFDLLIVTAVNLDWDAGYDKPKWQYIIMEEKYRKYTGEVDGIIVDQDYIKVGSILETEVEE